MNKKTAQGSPGVLVLLKPNVLHQRQQASVPPLVGETCTAPYGHMQAVIYPRSRSDTLAAAPSSHSCNKALSNIQENQKRYMTCKLDLDVQTLLAPVVLFQQSFSAFFNVLTVYWYFLLKETRRGLFKKILWEYPRKKFVNWAFVILMQLPLTALVGPALWRCFNSARSLFFFA